MQPTSTQVSRAPDNRSVSDEVALAFDGITSISAGSFFTMLARVMPGVERDLSRPKTRGTGQCFRVPIATRVRRSTRHTGRFRGA
jgi:hypothetical protein